MTYQYILTESRHNDDEGSLTIINNGVPEVITRDKNIISLVTSVINDTDQEEALANIVSSYTFDSEEYKEKFSAFNRVDMAEVAELISSVNRKAAVDAFVARVESIPDAFTRENLKAWISTNKSVRVTDDGLVIGYKGLRNDFTSVRSGYGIINGEAVNGHHDCSPGNVVEMPRELVDPDSSRACSFGLHVGNLEYANGWATKTVRVAFRPEDTIAIAAEGCKLRVSRYVIQDEMTPSEISRILSDGESYED